MNKCIRYHPDPLCSLSDGSRVTGNKQVLSSTKDIQTHVICSEILTNLVYLQVDLVYRRKQISSHARPVPLNVGLVSHIVQF